MANEPAVADAVAESSVIEGLACAAIQPGATGLLLLDAAPEAQWELASIYRRLLSTSDNALIPMVELPAAASEDQLWGEPSFPHLLDKQGQRTTLTQPAGLLAPPQAAALKLVIIPDLARLGLSALRAAIALIDAPVGHVERHGLSLQWPQHLRWLAFAQRGDMRFVSPHLLDRFSIRLPAQDWRAAQRSEFLSTLLQEEERPRRKRASMAPIPGHWLQRVRRARAREWFSSSAEWLTRWFGMQRSGPTLPAEVLDLLIELADINRGAGFRRELALGRMAMGCAQLAQGAVTTTDVHRAAELMGWRLTDEANSGQGSRRVNVQTRKLVALQPASTTSAVGQTTPDAIQTAAQTGATDLEPVYSGEAVRHYSAALSMGAAAFPEDAAVREETATSLKWVVGAEERRREERGHIIGALPTRSLHDLALLPTLVAAAPYQRLRGWQPGRRLRLLPADLRRHRRALIPRYQLIVVLDQSDSLGGRWGNAMQPHIEWAYQRRAPVTVIVVGSRLAEPRRAYLALLESRRAEAIQGILRQPEGHATPLAHGLFLALQQIEHLQRGIHGAASQIRLVVATDGRGNVPLMASLQPADLPPPYEAAMAQADALALAATLRSRRMHAFVLDPQPTHLIELPAELAAALGANLHFVDLK